MVVWRQKICDICGKETHNYEKSLIIKSRWILWHEAGWERLDICKDCAERMRNFIKNEQEVTDNWCESCARKDNCYTVHIRPRCFVPKGEE